MKEKENYRPALALAATYSKCLHDDDEMPRLPRNASTVKMEAKAVEIAKLVAKPVAEALAARRLYTAKAALTKADETIALRVTDPLKMRYIGIELSACRKQLEKLLLASKAKRDLVMDIAARDAAEGHKQLDAFLAEVPDYPDYDRDKLMIEDLRQAQVNKKFAKRLAAVGEIMRNDPAAAKALLAKLADTEADADELAILSSRLAKFKRDIFDTELQAIRAEMDDARASGRFHDAIRPNREDGEALAGLEPN